MATTRTVPTTVRFENILYATDFSRYSESALPYVLSIARNYGSRIFVANVISLFPFSDTSPTQAWQAMTAQAIREARSAMDLLHPAFKGTPYEALIRKGNISQELASIVAEKRIDLIVTGTHGRGGASKVIMGSVAENIIRRSSCPVLTVGPQVCGEPDAIADIHGILCPCDFSPTSAAAISYAVSLALQNRARLYLLHVVKGDASDLPEVTLKTSLHNLIPAGVSFSCEPRSFVEMGEPAEKILEISEELGVDLIVLGVKPPVLPLGAAAHIGMATAYKVIRGSTCPVLTVRKHA